MIITKRCIRCRRPVRADGTCQNPNCVRYVPEGDKSDTTESKTDNTTTKK